MNTREWRSTTLADGVAIVGSSPLWTAAVRMAERFAPTGLPILLVGATGTGKEVLAHHIHRLSGRPGPLVDVNCGALPRDMTESLLFGHRRGSFTGALEDSNGLVAQAAGGTLFLDELSSMPVEGQAKLLRVLDTGELRRLGDPGKRRVDFRVLAAVQEDVHRLVEGGFLRADLYHRVATAVIYLPRLCERPEDLGPLADHFARLHGLRLADGALRMLAGHEWPGNVRELRSVIDRAAVLAEGSRLGVCELREALAASPRSVDRSLTVAPAADERLRLLRLCRRLGGDRQAIAHAAGMSQATLYRRLSAAGIRLRDIAASQRLSGCAENPENPQTTERPADSVNPRVATT